MSSHDELKEARRLLAQRMLARRRLMHFTQQTLPSYDAGWVHQDIAARLERFAREVRERKSPRLMLLCPPRMGKACAHETPVPTPTGWTTHGALRVGDEVYHPSGRPVRVVAVSEECAADYEVVLTDGGRVVVHGAHEWTVYDRSRRQWRTLETRQLVGRRSRARYQLPLAQQPYEAPEAALPVDPYTLGVWLGDGHSTGASVCGRAEDMAVIVPQLRAELGAAWVHPHTGVVYQYLRGLSHHLRALGVWGVGAKHVPAAYLRGSVEQRRRLLAGLVDTDGTVCPHTGRVVYSGVVERLVRGVAELVRSLGYRASVSSMEPRREREQTLWVVQWTPHDGVAPGTLGRKRVARVRERRRVGVMEVRRVEPRPARCVEVAAEDGLYVVGEHWSATHNSELASIRFPAWYLGHNPDHEMIAASYSLDLPMGFSRKVRGLVRSTEYSGLFPDTALDPDSQSVEAWRTTRGGGYVAVGVGGPLTGRGCHVLTIDDPIKNMEEADSATVREKLWDWYLSTAYTRLAPGGGVLVIQTCWSDDDLAGRLQAAMKGDGDQFEIVKYPALAEQWEYRDDRGAQEGEVGPILRWDKEPPAEEVEGLRFLRGPGDAVHPARFGVEALERIKKTLTPRIWSALYQQNPVPDEGLYFKEDMFRYGPTPTLSGRRVYTAWDFAISEKQTADWTVGATVCHDEHDNIHVVDVVRIKGDADQIVSSMLTVAREFGQDPSCGYMIGVENGQIWLTMKPLLERAMRDAGLYVPIEVLKPLTDKQVRARPLQGRMQQGRVYFPQDRGWVAGVKHELLRFPAGTHDDVVDALAWAAHLVLGKEPPRAPGLRGRVQGWRDRLMLGGRGASHMAA